MAKHINISVVCGALLLSACGEPLKQADVVSKYSGHTVSKLTQEQRNLHLGHNDPSLGTRFIYHSANGRAYYFKETPKGYRRRESGRWWAGEDKICYSMRVTRAEDVEGGQCAPAGTDVVWSSFAKGDTRRLAPKSSPNASASSGRRQCVTGLEEGCSHNWLGKIIGVAAVAGAVVGEACSGGACDGLVAAGMSGAGTNGAGSSEAGTSVSGQSAKGWKLVKSVPIAGWSGRKKYMFKCNGSRSFTVLPCHDGKFGSTCGGFGGTYSTLESAATAICH